MRAAWSQWLRYSLLSLETNIRPSGPFEFMESAATQPKTWDCFQLGLPTRQVRDLLDNSSTDSTLSKVLDHNNRMIVVIIQQNLTAKSSNYRQLSLIFDWTQPSLSSPIYKINSHQDWGNYASHWSTAAFQIDTTALASKLYFLIEVFTCLFMVSPSVIYDQGHTGQ